MTLVFWPKFIPTRRNTLGQPWTKFLIFTKTLDNRNEHIFDHIFLQSFWAYTASSWFRYIKKSFTTMTSFGFVRYALHKPFDTWSSYTSSYCTTTLIAFSIRTLFNGFPIWVMDKSYVPVSNASGLQAGYIMGELIYGNDKI